jgi:two-component sensor histidine kinase
MDLPRPDEEVRNLLLSARKLALSDDAPSMVLLSVVDVTETRRRERQTAALMHEKAVLLNELNHRVANSLQIIASLLLQSARTVQSEEARTHIHAAHHRLMSVADLQKQLAISDREEVPLAKYLSSLCRSIGASMIRDRSLLSLAVVADDSTVPPNVALSLGLIVTELVINAIKHAFPGETGGRIVVSYTSPGAAWSLSVRDDGVGMPKEPHAPKSGLGTNIVRALVMQLDAEIVATPASPGTLVTVSHGETDAVVAGPEIAAV